MGRAFGHSGICLSRPRSAEGKSLLLLFVLNEFAMHVRLNRYRSVVDDICSFSCGWIPHKSRCSPITKGVIEMGGRKPRDKLRETIICRTETATLGVLEGPIEVVTNFIAKRLARYPRGGKIGFQR